jgi:hypothetical protein
VSLSGPVSLESMVARFSRGWASALAPLSTFAWYVTLPSFVTASADHVRVRVALS